MILYPLLGIDSPTYRTRLLICHRKWMLNLVDRDNITVSKQRTNLLETLWGKAYHFQATLRHFIACFCATSWLPMGNKPSKDTYCKNSVCLHSLTLVTTGGMQLHKERKNPRQPPSHSQMATHHFLSTGCGCTPYLPTGSDFFCLAFIYVLPFGHQALMNRALSRPHASSEQILKIHLVDLTFPALLPNYRFLSAG